MLWSRDQKCGEVKEGQFHLRNVGGYELMPALGPPWGTKQLQVAWSGCHFHFYNVTRNWLHCGKLKWQLNPALLRAQNADGSCCCSPLAEAEYFTRKDPVFCPGLSLKPRAGPVSLPSLPDPVQCKCQQLSFSVHSTGSSIELCFLKSQFECH